MPEREYHAFSGLDLLASAVVLVDDDFGVRYLNPAAENLVAASTKTLSGKPLKDVIGYSHTCLLYTSPSPRDRTRSRMPSSA